MTLQDRLEVYKKQLSEFAQTYEVALQNVHRLGGAISSVEDQIKEEAEAAATQVGEAAKLAAEIPELVKEASQSELN